MEEAWLRGLLTLPKSTPDFYKVRHLLTRTSWIPPKKGSIDPKKDIDAAILAKEHNVRTLAEITAEYGNDWESNVEQRGREVAYEKEKKVSSPAANNVKGLGQKNQDSNDSDENKNSDDEE